MRLFENLQDKLEKAFKSLKGQGKISEKNIQEAIKMVKLSLLEADVNYKVVKDFIERVKEKGPEHVDALGAVVHLMKPAPQKGHAMHRPVPSIRDQLQRHHRQQGPPA